MHKLSKKWTKTVAFAVCATVLVACLAVALASTLAKPGDLSEIFENPYIGEGKPLALPLEVGQWTNSIEVLGASAFANSHLNIVEMERLSNNTIRLKGLQFGSAVITAGTKSGLIDPYLFYVRDLDKIAAYTFSGGNSGQLSKVGNKLTVSLTLKKLLADGTYVNSNDFGKITWTSLNTNVAVINAATLEVTAVGKGFTSIIGEITDPWGEKHYLLYNVLVGTIGVEYFEDPDGSFWIPTAHPYVFIESNNNGDALVPTHFGYFATGEPKDGGVRDAYPGGGNFYIEDPAGSGIYKKINLDGTLASGGVPAP